MKRWLRRSVHRSVAMKQLLQFTYKPSTFTLNLLYVNKTSSKLSFRYNSNFRISLYPKGTPIHTLLNKIFYLLIVLFAVMLKQVQHDSEQYYCK